MSEWWEPSRGARLLAVGLSRQTPPPVVTFSTINSKFSEFEKTYLELLELLGRDGKSVDEVDKLTDPPLSQTLDEYHDFRYNAGTAVPFSKRKLDIPSLSYGVARYVYNDEDIQNLVAKLNWQIQIMVVKMEDMVL
jgi:hypothetical protein